MAGYRRTISYIYSCEDGEQRKSTGFVRLEARADSCRILIHLNAVLSMEEISQKAYLCVCRDSCVEGLLLGELKEKQGARVWKGTLAAGLIENSPYVMEDTFGVRVEESAGKSWAAEWKENTAAGKPFRVYRPEKPAEKSVEEERTQPAENPAAADILQEAEKQEESGVLQAAELSDAGQQRWNYLFQRFPHGRLRKAGGEEILCIRIGPRDLQRFPGDSRLWGANSFMLHGYHQYRHLLLCRRERERQAEYYLGVPGIYNEKEILMAEFFGFREFCRNGAEKNRNDGFGYWLRRIEES